MLSSKFLCAYLAVGPHFKKSPYVYSVYFRMKSKILLLFQKQRLAIFFSTGNPAVDSRPGSFFFPRSK